MITKGLKVNGSCNGIYFINDDKGRTIAQAWDWPEAEDNARLYAAAPDLLAACKSALQYLQISNNEREAILAAKLEAAIAKAEGR